MLCPDPIQAHHHWAQEYLRVRVSVTTTTSSLRTTPHSRRRRWPSLGRSTMLSIAMAARPVAVSRSRRPRLPTQAASAAAADSDPSSSPGTRASVPVLARPPASQSRRFN